MTALPTLALAYGADLLLGDPRWFPHPVRGLGWMIARGERVLRRVVPSERLGGALLVVGVVGTSGALTWAALRVLAVHAPVVAFLTGAIVLFSCLSTRDLAVESGAVLRALEAGDLPLARRRVARIVGRDTDQLDAPEVVRATLETIAESTLDGILSPLFYFVLGGVPLAVAYKAVNTLDSMVGHRSARYLRFGGAAATLDTAANWIPARLSAGLFVVAAWCCGCAGVNAWRCAWRDGAHGTVPNAGIPEAALAGALRVRLGGVNWYQGQAVRVAPLGDADRPLEAGRIREAIRLMVACSLIAWLVSMGVVAVKVVG